MFSKIIQDITQHLKEALDLFWSFNLYLQEHLGVFAQVTFDLVFFYFLLMLLGKIFKATLNLLFYVLIPSFFLSFLASFFIPFPFFNILPFCICLLLGINLLRS